MRAILRNTSLTLSLLLLPATALLLPPGPARAADIGEKVAPFSLKTVGGETVNLKDHLGSDVVVLALFHICEPCMNQALEMQALLEKLPERGVFVTGVNVTGDSKETVLSYLARFPKKVAFPYLMDPEKTLEARFQVRFTPVVYILDKNGVIRYRGSSVPADVLYQEVKKLL